jgi:hypothetical protein
MEELDVVEVEELVGANNAEGRRHSPSSPGSTTLYNMLTYKLVIKNKKHPRSRLMMFFKGTAK